MASTTVVGNISVLLPNHPFLFVAGAHVELPPTDAVCKILIQYFCEYLRLQLHTDHVPQQLAAFLSSIEHIEATIIAIT